MLIEKPCGKTHIQFFIEGICIATVRTEYAKAFREAVEKYAPNANGTNQNSEEKT